METFTPENIGIDTGIMFLSRRIVELLGDGNFTPPRGPRYVIRSAVRGLNFNVNYSILLDKISRCRSDCYIAGDFNINLLNCDTHSETEHFVNTVFSHLQFPLG